ncbi:amino acid adenylation domain-containing protein [Pantanalinema rosaneae CENA516]|uniref:amino acid adenylation domain-containing protein n=1 Tax=Pantanalinema rosaneae TaxID=1620701 RepID=UPI003D6E9F47
MVASNQTVGSFTETTGTSLDSASILAANAASVTLSTAAHLQTPTASSDPSPLQLPGDFLKLPQTTYQPEYFAFTLPPHLVEQLQTQASSSPINSRSLVLAAFHALLYRYAPQNTIRLNLTVSDQHQNLTSVIHTNIDSQLTSETLIDQLNCTLQRCQASKPDEVESATESSLPISITFIDHFLEDEAHWLSDFHFTSESGSNPDLHLLVLQQAHTISVILRYNANLFKPDTIKRLAGHLQVLVTAMLDDRNSTIAQLPLLTQAELDQLLITWQSSTIDYPQTIVHQYIETHAVQRPDAIAVRFKDQSLTYAALNQQANQLAHYLHQLGVGAEVRVAVCVEPSLDVAVSLFGIWKAGGVYVPLDPTYPAARLTTILEDTHPQVLLTQSHLLPNVPALANHIFCLDTDWELLQSQPSHNPDHDIEIEQTAYLVYTSGTTGKPKGVMASHGNLIHYLLAAQAQFGFNSQDVMPAIARFTFSITFFELLSPLVAGGTLLLLERDHILDFKRLVQTLTQVSVLHTSPSLMRKLLVYIKENGLDRQRFPNLRHASCGGDLVPADLLETMKTVFRQAEIYVIYGCSEVSCMACAYPVSRQQVMTKSLVGKPFNNVTVRLYDPQHNLVPIGIAGEIYISGAGITQGYLHQPELTQEKFVTIEQQRFYRTGDLGRFDASGNLEILGRSDFQIKLRGIRIELGDIETTLRQVPGVREGIVVDREINGEKSLVAYVVLDHAKPTTVAAMRQFLQAKLPDYMVPAAFVVLEAMPVNINQKIDRRALPAPTFSRSEFDHPAYVAPKTKLEKLLAQTWAEVLGFAEISLHDDFFALGGHSLMAAQVIYRLQDALSLEIPISRLFELPTIAALAEHLSQPADGDHPGLAPITPIQRTSDLPLSSAQSRLWFLSQLEEGIAYNIPLVLKLDGALSITALEHSLTEIARRHEALRTTFPVVQGTPVQRILPPQAVVVPIIDLVAIPADRQLAEVHRLAQAEAQRRFNLALDRPLRCTLLRLEASTHVLLVTMHHIASDGWSLGVFRRELASLYTAFFQGAASPLAELPIQYADFAHWQHQHLQAPTQTQHLTYWQQQLAGAPPLLELPTDRPRPPIQSFRGGSEFFLLDAQLTQQLKAFSQRSGATLFMTLLGALATLLSRYSQHHDIVIGSPIANRNRVELEPLIGFFINLLALRIDLSGDPQFSELLQRVRQVALDAYAHQDTPFEQVVEAVQPERNLSHSPLFQVLLILQNSPTDPVNLPGLTLNPLQVESGTAKYDITLMMEETEAGIIAELEYNQDLFDRATIRRMVGHFQTLLQGIIAEPEQPISALPLLTAAETQQVLVEWNQTDLAYPPEPCIHQLFESQVERTPDAIAIVFEDHHLTYRQLNDRANQVAHYLQTLGVKPEVIVGICLERSLEMVVGLLGILKAGGSYVPLDPAYPHDRLSYMIEDSQLPVLLTERGFQHQFAEQAVQIVCLDTDWSAIAQQPTSNLDSDVAADNLAYTIYTSGSTGKPKGVQICHHTAVNFLNSMRLQPGLTAEDILLAVTTISFDIAVLELYLPLMVGAQVILATRMVAADAKQLSDLLAQSGATVMQATPATWQMLLAGGWQGDRRLKMLCGGEAMSRNLADQLLERGSSLWNMYGPTETTVWSAACEVKSGTGSIPVAEPIANTQIYILAESSYPSAGSVYPVPVGIPGEVHIGGDGLARGYLNRPELTNSRFIPDPFSDRPNARLYKTGDLARFRPDGSLEFLGRIDHQVKVRGFRIELGEIEAVLSRYPMLKQGVVTVREDTPGDQRLVAYFTTKGDAIPTPSAMRQFLKEQLPDYMVPATFVKLDALPLTPNGKVDRRALPAPDPALVADPSENFVAPRDEMERQLVEIWQEVLQVQPIGIHDNFFELGGHSLSAVRAWAKVEEVFGKNLPITTLLQSPTIAELSLLLREVGSEEHFGDLVPLRVGGHKPPLFCLYGILLYRELAQQFDPDQPVYGVYLQEEIDLLKTGNIDQQNSIFSSVPKIAERYLQAIRTLQPHGPYYLAGESFGGVVAFEMAQQLQAMGEEVALIALFDSKAPLCHNRLSRRQRLKLHGKLLFQQGPAYLVKKVQGNLASLQKQLSTRWYRTTQGTQSAMQAQVDTTPQDIRQEVRDRAMQNYVPQPYTGRAVLFRAMDRDVFDYSDRCMGWSAFTDHLEIFDVPGDHLGILKQPNVPVLAEKLQAYLG